MRQASIINLITQHAPMSASFLAASRRRATDTNINAAAGPPLSVGTLVLVDLVALRQELLALPHLVAFSRICRAVRCAVHDAGPLLWMRAAGIAAPSGLGLSANHRFVLGASPQEAKAALTILRHSEVVESKWLVDRSHFDGFPVQIPQVLAGVK
eukprot:5014966-Prymnesium_polylepis.1